MISKKELSDRLTLQGEAMNDIKERLSNLERMLAESKRTISRQNKTIAELTERIENIGAGVENKEKEAISVTQIVDEWLNGEGNGQ